MPGRSASRLKQRSLKPDFSSEVAPLPHLERFCAGRAGNSLAFSVHSCIGWMFDGTAYWSDPAAG